MGVAPALLLLGCLLVQLWRLLCVHLRRKRSKLLARLHPLRHSHTIVSHTAFVDFPFLFRRSYEFALFRTYAIPSISSTLSKAGNFAANTSKRYDDTDLLFKELFCHHIDGDRGSLAVRRLNFIHAHYNISNADYLYVLSLVVLMPLDWISKYGYRDLTDGEKFSLYRLWHDVGTRMGIRDIPSTIGGLAAYKESYECKHMVYRETNKEIAELTINLLLSEVPAFARPIARRMVYAFMDDRLRKAVGYPKQPEWLSALVHGIVKMHGFFVRWMPPRPLALSKTEFRIPPGCPVLQGSHFDTDALYKLSFQRYKPHYYAEGYKIKELGAMKPGCVADAHGGELLLPLSKCSNAPWPLALLGNLD